MRRFARAGRLGLWLSLVVSLASCGPDAETPPEAEWLAGNWHQVRDICPGLCRVSLGYARMSVSPDGVSADLEWNSCVEGHPGSFGAFEVVGENANGALVGADFGGTLPSSLWGGGSRIELREENRCELTLRFSASTMTIRETWIRGRVSYEPLPEGCEGRLIPADEEAIDCHEFLSRR